MGDAAAIIDAAAPDATNACGGREALAQTVGTTCGVCGVYVCAGPERVVCDDHDVRNACGTCGPVPVEECNGHDDDCDGLVDEGCVLRLGPPELSSGSVRLSGDRAVLDVPVVVTLPGGEIRDLRAAPIVNTDGGMDYAYDGSAAIGGDLVAWVRHRGAPSVVELVTYDLRTGREWEVPSAGRWVASPAVDSERVVYELHSETTVDAVDVWLWAMATTTSTRVTGPEGDETSPELSGDWLVFERVPPRDFSAPSQIVARNLRTREEVIPSQGLTGWNRAPAIDGARIVWHLADGLNYGQGQGQVYLYDLETRQRRALGEHGSRYRPRIDGSLVCWSASPTEPPYSSMGDVTVFDLATGRSTLITGRGQLCDVSRRRVALLEYFDWSGGSRAYYRDLVAGEP